MYAFFGIMPWFDTRIYGATLVVRIIKRVGSHLLHVGWRRRGQWLGGVGGGCVSYGKDYGMR